jgi:enterochelin esterase family protein
MSKKSSNFAGEMKKLLYIVAAMMLLAGCGKPVQKAQVGTIERDTLLGVPCCVYLPHDYAVRAEKEVFPVLYLQHGMYGNEDDWVCQGDLLTVMDSLLCAGLVKEMVVVMPDNFLGSLAPEEREALMNAPELTPDGEQIDTSAGSAHWRKLTSEQEKNYETSGYWEEHFARFMAEAERRYPISDQPCQRAIAGLSMGGYHTMRVATLLDGRFAYVGMFSPATFVHQAPTANGLLWIGIGNEDFLYGSLQDYRKWLEARHKEYMYYESDGGHTWTNWKDYIGKFLTRIF